MAEQHLTMRSIYRLVLFVFTPSHWSLLHE